MDLSGLEWTRLDLRSGLEWTCLDGPRLLLGGLAPVVCASWRGCTSEERWTGPRCGDCTDDFHWTAGAARLYCTVRDAMLSDSHPLLAMLLEIAL